MQSGATAGTEAERLYQQRERRIRQAIALETPDRVPVVFTTGFWHARYCGRSCREVLYDHQLNAECFRRAIADLKPDGATPLLTSFGSMFDLLGFRPMRYPGHGAPDDVSFQYIDGEVMQADEYDAFLEDPSHFYLTRYLPRISAALAPLARLPQFPSVQNLRLFPALRVFADPEVQQALTRLPQIGTEAERLVQAQIALNRELADLGFPNMAAAGCPCPYDYFADYLRGSKGIMLDMYRRRDKLLEAMEFILPILTRNAIAAGRAGRTNIIFMALHWGLDGFMSVEQFKTFYWPFLRRQIVAQTEAGVVPCVFWEGDCTSRLETIGDIPKGKAIYWFERTDLHRARQVLGDVVCLRGGVPASLLTLGRPEEVRECCRQLIRTVGRNGGYILDGGGGGGIPDEAPIENVRAMFQAAHEP
jgi:uroporphyrinogen-III decarboxylase